MISKLFKKIINIPVYLKNTYYKNWNSLYFRINDVKIGNNYKIFNKVYLSGKGKVVIGDNFRFYSGGGFNPISRNIAGSIYTMTEKSTIVIGNNVGISSSCLWAKDKIVIGDNVNIGANCVIIDNDAHPHSYIMRRKDYVEREGIVKYLDNIPSAPIIIGNDVWIGMQCMLLKGVKIGDRTIVAAGSVVTNNIPSDVIVGGNPCKIIGTKNRESC